MTPTWTIIRGHHLQLGILPQFFLLNDPRPAREQLQERYAHGGGVPPFEGFTPRLDGEVEFWRLDYPGDPPTLALAYCRLREEMIILFEHSWVAIVPPGGVYDPDFVITRCD